MYHANLGNTGVLGQNERDKVNRSRPTLYDIYRYEPRAYTMPRDYIDLPH